MNNKKRIACLVALIAALLGGAAALALEAPPIIRGDANHDIRYPFAWAPRSGHAMVYDAARERVVVYGGLVYDWLSTPSERVYPTMEWDGAYWKNVRTASFPPANTGHAMAYDAERGVTVLFGGFDASTNILDETWLYDGTNWTRATPAVSPPRRAKSAMAYDSVSQRVLLYGGQENGHYSVFKDFWAWDGVNWTELGGVPTNMPALYNHAMAHDANRGVTVLYGGASCEFQYNGYTTRMTYFNCTNTWEWNGTTWSNRNLSHGIAGTPQPMTYDSDSKRILAMSWNGNQGLWAYDGASWVKTNTVGKSGPMAYDAARKEVVVFNSGTQDGGAASAGTWRLRGTNWVTGGFFTGFGPILFTDFNGDGRPDLLMPGYLPNTSSNGTTTAVALFLNGPSGFDYRPAWTIRTIATTEAALGDMNGDGLPDLALSGGVLPSGGTSVYLGVPGGLFASTPAWSKTGFAAYDTRPWPWWFDAMGPWIDVNGDGRLDLPGPEGSALVVYTNTGSTLANTPAVSLATPANMRARGVAWGDVNLDGAVDLAISFESTLFSVPHEVRIYTNNGTGTFTLAQTLQGQFALQMAFADLNGDWWPDLVAPRFAYTNQAGSFGPESSWSPANLVTLPSEYLGLAVGDVDGDGDPDAVVVPRLAVHGVDGNEAYVYRNDAGSLTAVPVWSAAPKIDGIAGSLALGDADGDGILDVATQRGIFLLDRIEHTGALPLPAPMWLRAGVNPADRTSALVEWDPVQDPDVAGYRLYADFWVEKPLAAYGSSYDHTALLAEVPATQTPQFVVTSNLIAEASLWNARPFYDPDPWDLPNEMDHDGHLDRWGVDAVVRVTTVDKAGREFGYSGAVPLGALKSANSALDSTEDFWWAPGGRPNSFLGVEYGPQLVGDLDGDGDLDLFVALIARHPVAGNTRVRWVVCTNDGSGSFGQAWEWRQGDDPADLYGPGRVSPQSLGDINGDGRLDLLCAASRNILNTNTSLSETWWILSAYTNTGMGFAADTNWTALMPLGHMPRGLTWGDANGDGTQDVAVVSFGGSAFLFLNQGGRLGGAPAWTSSVSNVLLAAFGALDNDGKADLAVCTGKVSTSSANYLMGAVVYKGTASGLAAAPVWTDKQSSLSGVPGRLTWADFNGDGWQDLTVHGDDRSNNRNHPTVLYRNNAGALAYLCVYKARDYKNGAGVGIGGAGAYGSFTLGWADMDHDGDLDLWGPDLILEADTPTFNAGPIGSQPAHWHGYANEEGLGYIPPWCGVVGVYDFNGDGTPDFLHQGSLMLRTPNSIYQADYVPIVWELGSGPEPQEDIINGKLELRPVGSLVLDGEGATQAITVVHVMLDLSEQVIPHTHTNLNLSLSGNPKLDLPYATLIGNVITAVRDGTVTVNAKYGNLIAGAVSKSYLTAAKSVRVINAAPVPDCLEITPTRVTLTRIGETVPLTASRQYAANGRVEDVTAGSAWQSSDAGVVAMDGQVAIARGIGVAEVVATYSGMTATSRVTVAVSATLAGLTLFPPEASVRVGETRGFEVRARFSDGTVQPVTFVGALASDAPGIAAVDGLRVLGVAPGFAHVTAAYQGQTATALVAVDAAVTNVPGGTTNALAMSQRLEILGFQRQGGNMALDWYCTPPTGPYTPFSVLTSTNLLTGPWTPIQTPVPRHPSGFHNWTGAINDSPAMFYKVTLP
jgi:hypothetical protein